MHFKHLALQWFRGLIATGATTLLLNAPTAAATTTPAAVPWKMVASPFPLAQVYIDSLRTQLEEQLQAPVQLQFDDPSEGLVPPKPGSDPKLAQRTIWLVSEGNSSLTGNPTQNPRHLANFEPLVIFMEIPWCLFALKNSPALEQKDLLSWLSNLGRPARIGVGVYSGSPVMWVHALSSRAKSKSKTGQPPLQVQARPFQGAEMLTPMLEKSVDLAISRCSHMRKVGNEVAVVAKSHNETIRYVPPVPTFTELGLPPLGRGWHGAFAPRNMAQADKQKLIKAFEVITNSAETQKAILDIWQIPLRIDHVASQRYIHHYIQSWQAIFELMERNAQEETTAPRTRQ